MPVDELSLLLSALAAHLPSMDWRPTDIFDYASLANKLAHSFEWADGQSGNESMQAFQLKNRAISVLLRRFPEFVEIEPDHESDQFCLVRLPRVVRTGLHVPVSVIEQCLGPNWRSRNGNTHSPPHA
ncbi:MAG: hypothetical protein Q8Q20_02550 [bacterium]|nr:hypothetical protein [bacterium]